MSTSRDIRLSPQDLAIKLATAEAVTAAGGPSFVSREIGRAQSVVSDWISPNTASFMPADMVRRVEALGAGSPGHPHVTRALARASGADIRLPAASLLEAARAHGMDDLGDWMGAISRDFGDLVGELAGENLAEACAALSSNARADIGREAGDLIDRLHQLRRAIDGCDGGGTVSRIVVGPPGRKRGNDTS